MRGDINRLPAEGHFRRRRQRTLAALLFRRASQRIVTDQTAVLAPATSVTTPRSRSPTSTWARTEQTGQRRARRARASRSSAQPQHAARAVMPAGARGRGRRHAAPGRRVELVGALRLGSPGLAALGGDGQYMYIATSERQRRARRPPARSWPPCTRSIFSPPPALGRARISRATSAFVFRGNAAGLGGFFFYARFATTTALAQQRAFVGALGHRRGAGQREPEHAAQHHVYLGYDSTQTTLRACGNDGAGAATCTDLGANFPVNATAVYDVYIYSAPAGSTVKWAVERLDSSVLRQRHDQRRRRPAGSTSTFLAPQLWVNNGTTASAPRRCASARSASPRGSERTLPCASSRCWRPSWPP
jgi:hypothetical protein